MVDAATIEVETPSDETLSAYLAANAKTYEAPEYRSITLLTLAPEDLLAEIEVSDADLRAAYDARIDLYRTPEQRKLEQLLAPDEPTIKRAAELAASGQSFTQVAEALKDAKVERSEVGPLAKGDLPEALDAAGFALAPGTVSAPVQTPFGWHLLRAQEIVPEQVQAVRHGQGGAAARAEPGAGGQPAARFRDPARRRAGGRHVLRRGRPETGHRAAQAGAHRPHRPHAQPRAARRRPAERRDPGAGVRSRAGRDLAARADRRRSLLHVPDRRRRARARSPTRGIEEDDLTWPLVVRQCLSHEFD